jgi:hypothetical protein
MCGADSDWDCDVKRVVVQDANAGDTGDVKLLV